MERILKENNIYIRLTSTIIVFLNKNVLLHEAQALPPFVTHSDYMRYKGNIRNTLHPIQVS